MSVNQIHHYYLPDTINSQPHRKNKNLSSKINVNSSRNDKETFHNEKFKTESNLLYLIY